MVSFSGFDVSRVYDGYNVSDRLFFVCCLWDFGSIMLFLVCVLGFSSSQIRLSCCFREASLYLFCAGWWIWLYV